MKSLAISLLVGFPLFAVAQHNAKSVKSCLKPFYHGVASGDPLPDRVILWTRITPEDGDTNPQIVEWQIAEDTNFTINVQSGVVITDASKDFTVKVDPTGLTANTTYYYQFFSDTMKSVIGRTRTAPVGDCDSLRFAIFSCANFEAGYFNVFASLKQRNDFDVLLGLGDYIYEYEDGGYAPNATANRHWEPTNETISLMDYRARYSTYRLDDDLRDLHQQFPMIVIWDDHESANDSWMNGAENHQPNEGSWAERKAASKQAFFEWLPIRVTGTDDPYQIFRQIQYGDLVDLIMLDTRLHGREEQAGTSGAVVTSSTRQLLGTDQFTWLGNRLDQSTAQWKVLGQQVMMAPLTIFGAALNGDQWDGYPAERDRVLNHITTYDVKDVVVITGDIHSSWANDLPTSSYSSNGSGSAGVEFVAPSVTSPGMNIPAGAAAIMAANSHIKYAELTTHGYVIMDVNKQRVQADWYYVNTIDVSDASFHYGTSFKMNDQTRSLVSVNSAAIPRANIQGFQTGNCPYYAPSVSNLSTDNIEKPIVLGIFPNPFNDLLLVNVSLPYAGKVSFRLVDGSGKVIPIYTAATIGGTTTQFTLQTDCVQAGNYQLLIDNKGVTATAKVVKR